MYLPREILSIIIRYSSSKTRSIMSSVSRSISEECISLILPNTYHSIVQVKDKIYNKLGIVCQFNDIDLVELMIEKGANDWNGGLYFACHSGNISIIELMIEKGANDWNSGLHGSCANGNQSIVELMIEKGANDWNGGLLAACNYGHLSIVKLMIEKGANNWNEGLYFARFNNRQDILDLLITKRNETINRIYFGLCVAIKNNS